MQELIIQFDTTDPVEIFGINHSNIDLLRKHFSKLKIIARGTDIKAMGSVRELDRFDAKIKLLIEHFNRFHQLTEDDIAMLLAENGAETPASKDAKDVITFGNNGAVIRARSPNQKRLVEEVTNNDMVFAVGPAGTGKTYTAVALAVRALKNKEVKRIILTRPAVEAGEHLGFLPGDLKEKLDPYLQPLYDALQDMLPIGKVSEYLEKGIIQIAPLAFMRGRTLDNAFVILDEAQNATSSQLKMFLTRMGRSAKFVITGDITQIDLPRHQQSGLYYANNVLKDIPGISFVFLDGSDVVRHKLVKKVIAAYEKNESKSTNTKAKKDESGN